MVPLSGRREGSDLVFCFLSGPGVAGGSFRHRGFRSQSKQLSGRTQAKVNDLRECHIRYQKSFQCAKNRKKKITFKTGKINQCIKDLRDISEPPLSLSALNGTQSRERVVFIGGNLYALSRPL